MANPQYESMLATARQRLTRHDPADIARRAGVTWHEGRFTVSTLGGIVTVTVPELAVQPALGMWHTLTLLHYLDLADGTPLSGKMMAFGQYPEGMVRGGGFDRRAETDIRLHLGLLPPEELRRRLLALGAALEPSTPTCAPASRSCPGIPCGCGSGSPTRNSLRRAGCFWMRAPPTI